MWLWNFYDLWRRSALMLDYPYSEKSFFPLYSVWTTLVSTWTCWHPFSRLTQLSFLTEKCNSQYTLGAVGHLCFQLKHGLMSSKLATTTPGPFPESCSPVPLLVQSPCFPRHRTLVLTFKQLYKTVLFLPSFLGEIMIFSKFLFS